MKLSFKSLIIALGALVIVSCNGKEDKPGSKPVVTEDMYSVTANSETGEVVFKFVATDLSPYWTVTDPKGVKTTFTDREVTKTYEVNGDYNGSIAAFNQAGESDPVSFSFTVNRPVDPKLTETELFLMANGWKPYHYGYCADATAEWWDWEAGKVPDYSFDDVMRFGKDGVFTLDLGADPKIFNDSKGGLTSVTITGNEKWTYVAEGDAEFIQFSDGGFPSMLGDDNGINGKYEIRDIAEGSFRLYYHQPDDQQYFYIILVPEDYVEPAVTEDQARAAISGKTFFASAYGWYGVDWEWFDAVPAQCEDDYITFKSDGSLIIDLGETPQIYNDGSENSGVLDWTVTGQEKWSIITIEGQVAVQFSDGGFPLMLAGAHTDASNPNFTHGLNAAWTIYSIDDAGIVRLDINQPFYEEGQWMSVFLEPAE